MDPFTIHCSSCQSRIRVRNPSMIGQIANCPKCGSMIMIAAPQQILVDSGTGSVTDSVAVTKEALPVPEERLLGDMQPLEQGIDHQAFRRDGLAGSALADSALSDSVAFESLAPTNWMPEPVAPPRIDETVTVSAPQPSRSRQIMLVAALGLCSVVLACGIFFAFLRWYARPTSVASRPVGASQPAVGVAGEAPAVTPSVNSTQPIVDAAQPDATSEPNQVPSLESDALLGAEVPDATPAAPSPNQLTENAADAGPDATVPAVPSADTSAATQSTAAVAPNAAPLPTTASGAPLGLQQSTDIDSTFAVPGADAGAQAVKETLPPGLQNFASIFDETLVPVLSDATVPLAEAPDAGQDDAPATEPTAATSPMTLVLPETLEQKQATTISGLLIQDRPLAEVLSTLSVMSDIPFSIDLDGLLAAGVDRNQKISFKSATPVSVLDVINALARDYRLSFQPYEKKLFIVRGELSAVQSRIEASLPIEDLVDSPEESAALSTALGELLPELGDGVQLADSAAQADLEKVNPLLWFQVARLLETWRAARGATHADSASLVPKSSHLPGWPVDAAQVLAQKQISQTLLPEPLAVNWHRLAREAGMTCWVDWPSLISAQSPPNRISMSISRGRPLKELLQHDADKYRVVFALEDERTLWVTSPEMHRFQPRLFVLPMVGKTVEQWRTQLEPLTPYHPDGAPALKVVATPDGQFVFIRCCRPILVQPQQ